MLITLKSPLCVTYCMALGLDCALTTLGFGSTLNKRQGCISDRANKGRDKKLNKEIFEGKWTQLKGSAREQWGKLTDNDVEEVKGNYEQFVGKVQERYGIAKEEAERQVDDWTASTQDRRREEEKRGQ